MGRHSAKSEQAIPTLSEVEEVLKEPASKWVGRCFEIARRCVSLGLIEGEAVYGHYLGKVHPRSLFSRVNGKFPFVKHGWVHVQGNSNLIFDPTRFGFEHCDPYLYFGPNNGEYDEGGNLFRSLTNGSPPPFDAKATKFVPLDQMFPSKETRVFVSRLFDFTHDFLTVNQIFWLSNLSYELYCGRAMEVYKGICDAGYEAAIPMDNLRKAQREKCASRVLAPFVGAKRPTDDLICTKSPGHGGLHGNGATEWTDAP